MGPRLDGQKAGDVGNPQNCARVGHRRSLSSYKEYVGMNEEYLNLLVSLVSPLIKKEDRRICVSFWACRKLDFNLRETCDE